MFFILLPISFAVGAAEKSILVYGDSISAAYGMAQDRGWVALLGERLKRERPDYSVVNASVSGETSSGGLARIDAALARHRPSLVILELGGNDGLRGLPLAEMKNNLGAIIERSQKAGARVLLLGMSMPPNYGPRYTQAFQASFDELAKRYRTALVPSLMEGFGDNYALFQPDRIHPAAEAQPLLLERVWKTLQPMLR
ncbi:MAG: arylesterase [Burkholderiales bacterium]